MKYKDKHLIAILTFEELRAITYIQVQFDGRLYYYSPGMNRTVFLKSPCCRYCRSVIQYFELWIDLSQKYSRFRFELVPRGEHQRKFNLDHVLPASKGGTTNFANLDTSCTSCNQKKGCKTEEDFVKTKLIRKARRNATYVV